MAHLTKKARQQMMIVNRQPLPTHVHSVISRGKEYFYFQVHRSTNDAGPRIKISNPWDEREIASAYVLSGNQRGVPDWPGQMRRVYAVARSRALRHKMSFALDVPSLVDLLNKQGHRCAVSGIYFEQDGYDDCHMTPFAISLDRIDSSRGYTKDNVRLVCQIANFAMNQWGIAALERLAEGVSTQRRKRTTGEQRQKPAVKPVKQADESASKLGVL